VIYEPQALWHIIPMGDLRDHVPEVTCWCNPEQDEERTDVYLHHSLDGREKFETGERKMS
jgi:hypothetical protein